MMIDKRYLPCEILQTRSTKDQNYDCVVIISWNLETLQIPKALKAAIQAYVTKIDSSATKAGAAAVIEVDKSLVPSCRVILTSTGPVNRDYDDVRRFGEAAQIGMKRHEARLIELEYTGEGDIEETLMFVGKGVTLDTGGTDLKINGAMYGLSRDKSGAAAVAGIFKVLDCLRPKHLKVMGYMCMVRNSIGPEAYTCDEILTARSGKRIRIVNTDAEGRITMLDPLCHMREKAEYEKNPHIFTIATLTYHATLAIGRGYSLMMDNGPALAQGSCYKLNKAGENIGDMVEVSRMRREDYDFHQKVSVTEYEDLRQADTVSSAKTERGHITPAAFMIMGSGLDEHGIDSENPIRYSHVDMAAAKPVFPQVPWGAPVAAFSARYILPNL